MRDRGTIFNIQHFSVHDGPGIRTVVFLKGCPLRCQWCANPESQRVSPQIAWTKKSCIGCQECVRSGHCAEFHFEEDGLFWSETDAGALEGVRRLCPAEALQVIGEERSVEEILDDVEKDSVFYENSLGGMTLSGGEPLAQAGFAIALLEEAKNRGIHCAMESCGYAEWESFRRAAGLLDYLLTDIKCMSDAVHKKYTGVSNRLILDNLRRLREACPDLPIHVRTPVIPGVNDSEESIGAIADFLEPFDNVRYELLKYHRLGEPKYESLHRSYPLGERRLDEERFAQLKEFEFSRIDYSLTGEVWEGGAGI